MKHSQRKLLVPLLIMTSLGLVACNGVRPLGTEATPPGQVNQQQEQGLLQVMLPVKVRIELPDGNIANHELLGFNPETRQLQLAGLSQGLSLTEVAKIERDRQPNQGVVLRGRPNIRGEDLSQPETWRVPFSAIQSGQETQITIRGPEAWEEDDLLGKLELQIDYEFVLDEIIPLSEDEMDIVVSKVRRHRED